MPELPEVETVCRGLNQLTLDQIIEGGEVWRESSLAYPVSAPGFLQHIHQQAIAQWQRRGKYLIARFQDKSGGIGVHLRMTGQLLWVERDRPPQKHTRLRLFFPGNRELRFVDVRTFGRIWGFQGDPYEVMTGLQKLGPEPLEDSFTPEVLTQSLARSQRPIKSALLDQRVVAGLGNIYADEALFLSKIRPDNLAARLQPPQIQALHRAIVDVLQTAIAKGGTTISDFLNPLGVNGNYGQIAWVYRRTQQPCRLCGTPIERIKLAGRSTHYCPRCQS
ncbi:MAG: DNA-formamidopyrimidine glycosylase [Jaaginema sp. PMC 1079.18]|nr:DNA-formamidopyrimidine glycosylase [Jaaginema sp. PMC 1080.18]MEC4850372.1 DNA-formamidopyrimidine glycosylase [Jaaginema sp. PMC 1079.18]MEC4864992.1 DNA-formamidopyrimidine glycosylase [Jaaginema sp. PMC 1078.18]